MLIRKGNRYELYPHQVTYNENDKEITKYALPSKRWWEETADRHDHINIIEFTQIEVTEDMQKRFEEIQNMPEDFTNVYAEYVLNGTLPDGGFPNTHPFRQIILENENKELKQRTDLAESAIDFLIMNGGL